MPFISQGGSAIISNLIGVGLLLSMSYQTHLADESGRTDSTIKKLYLKKSEIGEFAMPKVAVILANGFEESEA